MMNRLTTALAAVCREQLLDEKWLVAPSRRVGYQWLDVLTRSAVPVVNVRVTTPRGLALDCAAPTIAERGVQVISPAAATVLLDRIWSRRSAIGLQYFGKLQNGLRLAETLQRSIQSLRLAGVGPDAIRDEAFEVPDKARDLAAVYRDYLAELERRNWIDFADVFAIARERMESDATHLDQHALVLIPADLELSLLERRLIEAIPAARRRTIAVDLPGIPTDEASEQIAATDVELLRFLPKPDAAHAPRHDATATIFRAVGEINEVREVLRRCVAAEWPLDEVELLVTDTETYVPLLFETARRFQADESDSDPEGIPVLGDGLPVTFADGVPVRYTRPGRALAAWLAWRRDGMPQIPLARMIQDGLLDVPGRAAAQISLTRLAAVFRSVGIGAGDRYGRALAQAIAACDRQLARPIEDEDGEASADRFMAVRRRREALELLRGVVDRLLALTPSHGASPAAGLLAAQQFLDNAVRTAGEFDNLARQRLRMEIGAMAEIIGREHEAGGIDPFEWLANLPGSIRVGGSGPRPGKLHVASIRSGGHSGRPHSFVVGLDDGRFPGGGMQDPVLLDAECRRLSPDLRTAADALHQKVEGFHRLAARLLGTATLSYSCRGLDEDREQFPSPMLLTAQRLVTGRPEAEPRELISLLSTPASFAPADSTRALDESEWWLWRLCVARGVVDAAQVVLERYSHLRRGASARAARASLDFSEYDGWVPAAGADCDPTMPHGRPLSPSGLEVAGRCPLQYFFRHVLRLKPPDEIESDATRWLEPREFGSLLHGVLYEFMARHVAAGTRPHYDRDLPVLHDILERHIADYADRIPPPNESAYRRRCRELRQTIRAFLADEERHCRTRQPVYLEAAIGLEATGHGTPLDSLEPAPVTLPDGRQLRLRGRIDRIDRIDGCDDAYEIWDYKSGSPSKFTERRGDTFQEGRIVQHAVYTELAAMALRRVSGGPVTLRQFGYFFPGVRGGGKRVTYSRDALRDAGTVLGRLCNIIGGGNFLATSDKRDCRYCDYLRICGDVAKVAESSQHKLGHFPNATLDPMRELRGDEPQEATS